MAATFSSAVTLDNPGGIRFAQVTLTPADEYVEGGVALVPSRFGYNQIIEVLPAVSAGGVVWVYNKATQSAVALRTAAIAVEGEAAEAGIDALSLKAGVLNKESTGADTVLAQAGLAEVEDDADLSADPVTFTAICR